VSEIADTGEKKSKGDDAQSIADVYIPVFSALVCELLFSQPQWLAFAFDGRMISARTNSNKLSLEGM